MSGEEPPRTPEPEEIKQFLRGVLEASGERGKYIVFTGNRLPKYLWDMWETILKRRGLTWQDLLRAVSRASDVIIAWLENEVSWEDVVEAVWRSLPKRKTGEKVSRTTRSLEEYFSP